MNNTDISNSYENIDNSPFDINKFPEQSDFMKTNPIFEKLAFSFKNANKEQVLKIDYVLNKQVAINSTKNELNSIMI